MSCISFDEQIDNQICNYSPNCHNECYDIVLCKTKKSEKDVYISQLKGRAFELELREKDFNALKERYDKLLCDIEALNDYKVQLECEKNIKDDKYNKSITELQGENNNLQINYNQKLNSNKNIFSENNSLGNEIELKEVQICQLKCKLNELLNHVNKNNEDRANLQTIIEDLTDIKENQEIKLTQLLEDNETLNNIIRKQDSSLKESAALKEKMIKEIEDKNNNIKSINFEIAQYSNDIIVLEKEIDKMNNSNMNYQNAVHDYEIQLNDFKCENENLKINYDEERAARMCQQKKNQELNVALKDREKKIEMINLDISSIKRLQYNSSNKNILLQEQIEKYRNHIMILTELNVELNKEIDDVIAGDTKMKAILNRKERINSVLANNKLEIDQSLNSLGEYINSGKCIGHP